MPSLLEETQQGGETRDFGISELVSAEVERCGYALEGNRVNLIIPVISEKKRNFGGVATAIRFLHRLTREFEYARIIVTHETQSQVDMHNWPGWSLDHDDISTRSILFLGDKTAALAITPNDFFVATFWSTAVYIKSVIANQSRLFAVPRRRFAYLIQEYEPAFYPGSARYTLAESTYRDRDGAIAIFNSRPMAEVFKEKGLQFSEQYVFGSMLNPRLQQLKAACGAVAKEPVILVYARPTVPQNDFDLVVESLRTWVRSYPAAEDWRIVSAGEAHEDIPLGRNVVIRSLGTLSLDEYARELARCWVGVAFTFNASTSHAAREMVDFGAWLVTNQFEYRRPADLPPNVLTIEEPTPENVARNLVLCCERYRPDRIVSIATLKSVFNSDGEEFPFVPALMNSWCESRHRVRD